MNEHPFFDDEIMQTVQSIREHGVLAPAIVRPLQDGTYEIISGHRPIGRMAAKTRTRPKQMTGQAPACLFFYAQKEVLRMRVDSEFIGGHSVFAVERFADDTRHVVIFEALTTAAPSGTPGELIRWFLTDNGYTEILEFEKTGAIKILKYAAVIEGHIGNIKKKD